MKASGPSITRLATAAKDYSKGAIPPEAMLEEAKRYASAAGSKGRPALVSTSEAGVALAALRAELGREPLIRELAARLGVGDKAAHRAACEAGWERGSRPPESGPTDAEWLEAWQVATLSSKMANPKISGDDMVAAIKRPDASPWRARKLLGRWRKDGTLDRVVEDAIARSVAALAPEPLWRDCLAGEVPGGQKQHDAALERMVADGRLAVSDGERQRELGNPPKIHTFTLPRYHVGPRAVIELHHDPQSKAATGFVRPPDDGVDFG